MNGLICNFPLFECLAFIGVQFSLNFELHLLKMLTPLKTPLYLPAYHRVQKQSGLLNNWISVDSWIITSIPNALIHAYMA